MGAIFVSDDYNFFVKKLRFQLQNGVKVSQFRIVDVAAVGDGKVGNSRNGQEGEVEDRVRQAASEGFRPFIEFVFFLSQFFRRHVGSDAGNGQGQEGYNLSVEDDDLSAAIFDEGIGC